MASQWLNIKGGNNFTENSGIGISDAGLQS